MAQMIWLMRGRTGWTLAAAAAVTAAALLAGQAGAAGEPPRQTYSDHFTTQQPGASTGRSYAIDYFRPGDPQGKPHAFSHLRVELAEGARFDTSAMPQCKASDAELMAAGAAACPAAARVGVDETVVDTGIPGSGRYFTTDFVFFNNRDELILLANAREYGLRVVVRGQIRGNTLDIENPVIPGTPPDGAAARSQRGRFEPSSTVRGGSRLNYLTTPPSCPKRGYWVNRVIYTYRDGVKQTEASRSPCRPRGAGGKDGPRVRIRGLPRGCASGDFRVRVVARGRDAAIARTRLKLGDRRLRRTARARFTAVVPAQDLAPGRHRLRAVAWDRDGNRALARRSFRRCRA